jgi:hypothetical protein
MTSSRRRVVALALPLLVAGLACRERLNLRTDLAPLERRLALPAGVRGTRWVAVPEHEEGCVPSIPEPDARAYLYAALALDASAWKTLGTRAGTNTATGAITLPAEVAHLILSPSLLARARPVDRAQLGLNGQPVEVSSLSKMANVGVRAAVRVDDTLLVVLFISRG